MSDVLFLVPCHFSEIGGMKLPIENYLIALRTKYNVIIHEISYHPSKKELGGIINKNDLDKYEHIIVYGLNQAYGLFRYLRKYSHKTLKRSIGLLIDSESLYADSIIKNTKISFKNLKSLVRMYLKKAVYNIKEKKCLQHYDKILYVSSVDKKFVEEKFHNIKAKVSVVENGVTIRENIKTKKHDANNFVLGFFSTFTPGVIEENLRPIIEQLFPQLLRKNPNIRLIIAGRGMEDFLKTYLSQFDHVDYMGPVSDLADFYDEIDVAIPITLKANGILNKVLEAWMFGKTVIAYDYNFYAFTDAIDGVHYLSGNTLEDISDTVIEIINDVKKIDTIGKNARLLILENYSWETKRKQFLDLVG